MGTLWEALDLAAGRLHVTRALTKGPKGEAPRFGPPKTDRGRRAVPHDPETVRIIKEHRRRQLEERLALGQAYQDYQLSSVARTGSPSTLTP